MATAICLKKKMAGRKEKPQMPFYLSKRANSNKKRSFVFHGGHSEKYIGETLTGN